MKQFVEQINIHGFIPFVISVLLHPVIIPTLGVSVILNIGTLDALPFTIKYRLIALIFGITAFIPILIIGILRIIGLFQSFQMQTAEERRIPLLLVAIANYITSVMLSKTIPLISNYLLIITIIIVIAIFINLSWKISLHSLAMGGFLALIAILNILYFTELNTMLIIAIILSGLVMTCRLMLQEHSPAQIYAGFGIGFVVTVIGLVISI